MAENTKIEWTDHTFNPWIGCTKVGPGCDHCYAENLMDKRMGVAVWGPGNERVRTKEANWKMPLRWNAQADAFMDQHGRRQRVFCASLADVFDNAVDPQWRDDLFELIAATPNLDWLLLTKRIGNVGNMLPVPFDFDRHFPHVWIGATIVNQAEADRDIPKLLDVPARVRFLSMEPLLGPVDINPWLQQKFFHGGRALNGRAMMRSHPTERLDWVIVGGESGPGARPMSPDWARSLRDQCAAAGVPFLFKQWGEWETCYQRSDGTPVFRQFDSHEQWVAKASSWVNGGICLDRNGKQMNRGADMAEARDAGNFPVTIMHKVGKKKAGRLLDGREHNGFPMQPPKNGD